MHGKQFLMDEVFAVIDKEYVYGRLDFVGKVPEDAFEVVVNLESVGPTMPPSPGANCRCGCGGR